MIKKVLIATLFILMSGIPIFAEETVIPEQQTQNTKGFAGINYNRQDTEQTGHQVIVNDHSAFNININIFKKGALFKNKDIVVGTEQK